MADADPLDTYRSKRDFAHTSEPSGESSPPRREPGRNGAPAFVVQHHRARRAHFDLRLEIGGVLVSWAVPRGPTLDPTLKRLAVRTEDHPLEYLHFEGVIPHGEYGAGDMIVWDTGTWELLEGADPETALEAGELRFALHGERLHGRFVLTRTRRRDDEGEHWLLLRPRAPDSQEGWEPELPLRSVLSGRTNDDLRHLDTAPPPVTTVARWHAPGRAQLDDLVALGPSGTWHVDGVDVPLTNLDKVLYAGRESEPPITKRELVAHYARVSPFLLAYLHDRPVNVQRFPDGVSRPGFWQKELPSNAPEWLGRWRDPSPRAGRTEWYAVLDRPAAVVFMANLGVVELHPWTSSAARPDQPDWALIDIDPGPATTFDEVIVLARLFRTALDHLGLLAAPKVTGQRGVQVWIPLAPGLTFERTRTWVEALSRSVGSMVPELVSWSWRTEDRGGRARLDYTQNAHHKTLVAPWSLRPGKGAPASVPIRWDELDDPALTPDRWGLRDVPARLASVGDPMLDLVGRSQTLPTL